MIIPRIFRQRVGAEFIALIAIACISCRPLPETPERGPRPEPVNARVEIAARTPELKTFSCVVQCHAKLQTNHQPRELTEFHISKTIEHGPVLRWCDRCHDGTNYDQLRLVDGTAISFDETHRLCGQCHGDKLRDFEFGIHGRQTGSWSGAKTRLSCAACHNPHAPKRPPFEAMPAPAKPGRGPGGTSHEL